MELRKTLSDSTQTCHKIKLRVGEYMILLEGLTSLVPFGCHQNQKDWKPCRQSVSGSIKAHRVTCLKEQYQNVVDIVQPACCDWVAAASHNRRRQVHVLAGGQFSEDRSWLKN